MKIFSIFTILHANSQKFHVDLISRISSSQIFRVDKISRKWPKYAKIAKFNLLKVFSFSQSQSPKTHFYIPYVDENLEGIPENFADLLAELTPLERRHAVRGAIKICSEIKAGMILRTTKELITRG